MIVWADAQEIEGLVRVYPEGKIKLSWRVINISNAQKSKKY